MSFARPQRKKRPDHLIAFELDIARQKADAKKKKGIAVIEETEKFSYPESRLGTAGSRRSNSRNSNRTSTSIQFKVNEKGSPTTSVLNDKDKLNYNEVPGMDLRTAMSLDNLRNRTVKDVGRVHELLVSASAVDCRADGVGSFGGAIARLVKAPGPHNGHNEIKDSERLLVSTSQDSMEEMKKYVSKEVKPVLQPVWDKTFAYLKSPCQRLEKVVSQTSIVKKQVQLLCTKYYITGDEKTSVRSSNSSIATTKTMKSKTRQQSVNVNNVNNNVEYVWDNKINTMIRSSDDIRYLDLVDITRVVDADNSIIAVFGYICILLGLKPTWDVIRTTIFSELPAVFKLFKQLEPRSIPIKRLKKAHRFKLKKQSGLTVIGGNQKTLIKVLMWCNYVESISQLIRKVHKSCKEQGKIQAASVASPEKTENHSAIESIMEKQKQAHSKHSQLDYVCTLSHGEFLKELDFVLLNDKTIGNDSYKNDDNSTIDTLGLTLNKDKMDYGSSLNNSISSHSKADDDDYENDYDNEFEEDGNDSPIKTSTSNSRKDEQDRIAQAKEAAQEAERISKERLRREEEVRIEREAYEKERIEREAYEKERIEREAYEKERIEREAYEKELLRKADEERREREEIERERIEKERIEKERIEREEAERLEKEALEREEERLEKEAARKRIREFEEAKARQMANDKKALEALSLIEAATGKDMMVGLGSTCRTDLLDDIMSSAKPIDTTNDITDKEQDDKYMDMAFETFEDENENNSNAMQPTQEPLQESNGNAVQQPAQEPLQMGDRVEGNYKGHGTWYPGTLSLDRGISFDIAYDDGERETWVPVDRIRRLESNKTDEEKAIDEKVVVPVSPVEEPTDNQCVLDDNLKTDEDIPAPVVSITPNEIAPSATENDDEYADDEFES